MNNNGKFDYLDIMRGWAMIIMVEVHVFNAFLKPEIKLEGWFPILDFINGIVAPSFIFIAGFAFIVSSKNKIDDLRSLGPLFRKKLKRIGFIFLVGYLIHIPYFSLKKNLFYTDESALKRFCNVDVLQCIGLGMLILLILRVIIKSERIFNLMVLFFLLVFVLLAPIVWHIDFNKFMPLFFACYFNEIHGSLFPIFPWLGFLFAGAITAIAVGATASVARKDKDKYKEELFMKGLAIAGLLFFVAAFPAIHWFKTFTWFEIRPSISFFAQRLGVVFILLYLLRLYCKNRNMSGSYFSVMGRESLIVYWLHLQVIYRLYFGGKNINSIVNQSFGVIECLISTLILIVIMIAVAVIWGSIKKKYPESVRKIFISFMICGIVFFCIL
ncbi:MAG: heparan-alpha-glucosaminide N-acetyltransferase domain-containing protein [Leptospirales bacterium]|nr:heparan-alpha-glucosaminide N-acetyltransferase domain-containing protein [Leptospirales bacterium]